MARREAPGPIQMQTFISKAEYRKYADEQAQKMLGMSYRQAMKSLARGELEGTLAETRLKLMSAAML